MSPLIWGSLGFYPGLGCISCLCELCNRRTSLYLLNLTLRIKLKRKICYSQITSFGIWSQKERWFPLKHRGGMWLVRATRGNGTLVLLGFPKQLGAQESGSHRRGTLRRKGPELSTAKKKAEIGLCPGLSSRLSRKSTRGAGEHFYWKPSSRRMHTHMPPSW